MAPFISVLKLSPIAKTFSFGSDYSGSLFVEDSNGCLESLTYGGDALTFDDYFTIKEPNVFTPNGDNMNDEFIIEIPALFHLNCPSNLDES